MKTSFKVILISIAVMSATALLHGTARAADDVAALASVSGDVSVKTGDADWQKAKAGMALDQGAQIKTGKGGEAIIKWSQGHMLKLYPLTVMTLDKISLERRGNKETTELSFESGKILARAEKLASDASSFQIKTPTAVAGVRGTSFMIEVSDDSSSRISLLEGQLDITSDQVELVLEENSQVDFSEGLEEAPEPEELSSDAADEIKAGLEEFDSVPDVSAQSSSPAAQKTPPADPPITARDMMHDGEFVGDNITDTIEDVMVNPDETDIVIEEEEPFIPPMPPGGYEE